MSIRRKKESKKNNDKNLLWPTIAIVLPILSACGGHFNENYQIEEGSNVTLIDTRRTPSIADGFLYATLQDGHRVKLKIKEPGTPEPLRQEECPLSFYQDIGSFTYVEKTIRDESFSSTAQKDARRNELRAEILRRRETLKDEFLARFSGGSYTAPENRVVTCNLTLQPDDRIYMRLRFNGPASSNVTVNCLTDENGNRARIENPATTSMLKGIQEDPEMIDFSPANCGLEPLESGGDRYIDDSGAVISRCDPVKNVTVNRCQIRGRITGRSMGGNYFKLSMPRADHVKRLRESAAQHINFSNVKITGRYKGAVHFLPGVHHVTIEDSEVYGGFIAMTIHLPSDGGWNVIKNNKITGQRKTASDERYLGQKREVISIDSSEHNRIVNNYISNMPYGAIKLYRNCGERNEIRHRTPQYNQIINNIFDYARQDSNHHTIDIGSRDDVPMRWSLGLGVKRYCDKDLGRDNQPFAGNDVPESWDTRVIKNSSESNSDWAEHNVIADNQVIHKNVSEEWAFHLSSKASQLDNYIIKNEVVYNRSAADAWRIQNRRGPGCAVLAGITHEMSSPYAAKVRNGYVPYIRNRESISYFWDIRPEVRLACGTPLVCENNILKEDDTIACHEPDIYDYGNEGRECDAENVVCVEGDNGGDEEVVGCPEGKLMAVQAACNLEYGKATDAQRKKVLLNRIEVVKPSDNVNEGLCTADGTAIHQGRRLIMPWLLKVYEATPRPDRITYACKEHDRNGGDCHMNIRHYCLPDNP